jgi:hypothetical protein
VFRFGFSIARIWWRLRCPLHEGALVAVYAGRALLLVRTSYRIEWHFPGGTVRRGETPVMARIPAPKCGGCIMGASRAGQSQFCSHQDMPLPRHFGVFMTIEHLTSIKLPVPTRADFLRLQRAESAEITFVERLRHQEWPDNGSHGRRKLLMDRQLAFWQPLHSDIWQLCKCVHFGA